MIARHIKYTKTLFYISFGTLLELRTLNHAGNLPIFIDTISHILKLIIPSHIHRKSEIPVQVYIIVKMVNLVIHK